MGAPSNGSKTAHSKVANGTNAGTSGTTNQTTSKRSSSGADGDYQLVQHEVLYSQSSQYEVSWLFQFCVWWPYKQRFGWTFSSDFYKKLRTLIFNVCQTVCSIALTFFSNPLKIVNLSVRNRWTFSLIIIRNFPTVPESLQNVVSFTTTMTISTSHKREKQKHHVNWPCWKTCTQSSNQPGNAAFFRKFQINVSSKNFCLPIFSQLKSWIFFT